MRVRYGACCWTVQLWCIDILVFVLFLFRAQALAQPCYCYLRDNTLGMFDIVEQLFAPPFPFFLSIITSFMFSYSQLSPSEEWGRPLSVRGSPASEAAPPTRPQPIKPRVLVTLCRRCHVRIHRSLGVRYWLSGLLLNVWRELDQHEQMQITWVSSKGKRSDHPCEQKYLWHRDMCYPRHCLNAGGARLYLCEGGRLLLCL